MSNHAFVPMMMIAGGIVPSQIHLPDASTIFPDADAVFRVPPRYVIDMEVIGLRRVAGTTHV